ncbi:uncharacterized protein LOC133339437 [Lethenteron reissneri]|uniref:uncharacterized protein LOC133339437 n=1 Tax=Lethenteron reissneri TaxID=7753 RepID=UPI002AB6D68A|nr:uncharacterized protein LOC133339437 [Lethenteron reissneri]
MQGSQHLLATVAPGFSFTGWHWGCCCLGHLVTTCGHQEPDDRRRKPYSPEKRRIPGRYPLERILWGHSQQLINFISCCLRWDPKIRMTPEQALRHSWLQTTATTTTTSATTSTTTTRIPSATTNTATTTATTASSTNATTATTTTASATTASAIAASTTTSRRNASHHHHQHRYHHHHRHSWLWSCRPTSGAGAAPIIIINILTAGPELGREGGGCGGGGEGGGGGDGGGEEDRG